MTEPRCRPRPTTYAKHPDHVWQAVRADYLAGHPLAQCAERHGVGYDAAYWRSRHHGWREDFQARQRATYAAASAIIDQRLEAGREPDPPPTQPQTPDEAARAAFAQSAQALAEGRPGEAQVWARLAKSMSGMRLPGDGDSAGGTGDDPASDDGETPAHYRTFRSGVATVWDNLTLMAERRLDMLLRDFWTGGPWDSRWNKPSYAIDRDGRIVRTWEVEGSWFDGFADDAERRAWMNAPLPISDIAPPPLGWILDVWLPHWNQHHPEKPCTEVEATMIHQLYTRDPRLEWGYVDPRVQVARAKWEAEQREKGLPLPVIKAPWSGNEERRRERERGAPSTRQKSLDPPSDLPSVSLPVRSAQQSYAEPDA